MTGNGKLLIQFLKNVETIVIPVYQRNYDWKIEHCRKLFQDLCSTIQKRRMHFFGGIVSVSDPMGGTFDLLIIDGQQRLTTISLLVLAKYSRIFHTFACAKTLTESPCPIMRCCLNPKFAFW